MQDKEPRNINNKPNGYWETYCNSNRLRYKCFYVKNIEYGYTEYTKRKLTKKLYTAR
jgi:hypothetical protein